MHCKETAPAMVGVSIIQLSWSNRGGSVCTCALTQADWLVIAASIIIALHVCRSSTDH